MSKKPKLKFKEIIKGPKPVLVDFYATWCGSYKALSPIVDDAKIALGPKMKVIKVDVDKKQSISNKYQIKSLPTLAIFQNGEIVWRASGMRTKNEMLAIAHKFIKTPTATKSDTTALIEKKSWLTRLLN